MIPIVRKVVEGPSLTKDHGYAWVVLALSFLTHTLHVGFSYSVLGPLCSVLIKRFSCRVTSVFGGFILTLSIGLCSLATQPWHVYLLFGVMAAFGSSLTYVTASDILAHHFDRHRYLAFSVACLGYYVGVVVWPSFSQKLLDDFGYSKTMAIIAIFHVTQVFAGFLYYQPSDESPEPHTVEVSGPPPPHGSRCLACALSLMITILFILSGEEEDVREIIVNIVILFLCLPVTSSSNIFGCVCVILTSNLEFDRVKLHISCITVYSSATVILAYTNGKVMYYTLAAVWGAGQGALIANLLAVVYDCCGGDQLTVLFGLLLCAEGIGGLIGAPLCGIIERNTSPMYSVIFAGCCGLLGAMVLLPVSVIKTRKALEAEGLTLKALVLEQSPDYQKEIINRVTEAADPDYPHLHRI